MAEHQEKTLSSRPIYEGRVITVRLDTVEMEGGRIAQREIVAHRGAVALIALDEEGRVLMVRQYRKPAERSLLELPAGTMEPGEDPAACAQRELEEETGYRAAHVERLVGFYPSPGFCTEYLHIYRATGLSAGTSQPDEDEQLELAHVALPEARRLIEAGEIADSKSIIGVLLALEPGFRGTVGV